MEEIKKKVRKKTIKKSDEATATEVIDVAKDVKASKNNEISKEIKESKEESKEESIKESKEEIKEEIKESKSEDKKSEDKKSEVKKEKSVIKKNNTEKVLRKNKVNTNKKSNAKKGGMSRNPDDYKLKIDLTQLRNMSIFELNDLATQVGIVEHNRLKKSELIFKILRKQSENNGISFGGGVLEITQNGYGFLRSMENNYKQSLSDIYISPAQIKRFSLKSGDHVFGQLRAPTPNKDNENYFAMLRIEMINNEPPEECKKKVAFEDLTPIFPNEKFKLENSKTELSTRIIDLFAPIGKGQRALVVAQPKSGKTVLLQQIAKAIVKNNREVQMIVLLIDERPEEVTDFQRIFKETDNVEVVASTFDEDPKNHIHLAEIVRERAKRLVEYGKDVVIMLDSVTRLTRGYNATLTSSGKVLSGGIDATAFTFPKRFFGAARKIENGGSLTIIATALIDTGSKMDEVIFEEFKGTGNMELVLDRKLADRRIFPAIDVVKSGTRKEERLLTKDELSKAWILRKIISDLTSNEAIEFIMDNLKKYESNLEFLKNLNS